MRIPAMLLRERRGLGLIVLLGAAGLGSGAVAATLSSSGELRGLHASGESRSSSLLQARQISPDNTCGTVVNGQPGKGYKCGSSSSGPCCSAFGHCGSGSSYCAAGCQSGYSLTGSCLGGGSTDSPDNSCGSSKPGNYKCHGGSAGPCCSKYGFCGKTAEYCGIGCQASFSLGGICSAQSQVVPSPDNTCGLVNNGANKGYTCTSANRGTCCSRYGNCGSTPDYCEVGCQKEFGSNCANISSNGRCGNANNGARCPSGKCCSEAGYCGTTTAYCKSPSCQVGMGVCDSDITPAGTNTSTIARQRLGNVPYGVAITQCTEHGKVALTYDDGPYIYTDELLDVLKANNATATFFVTGVNNGKGAIDQNSTGFPDVLRRMDAEGHQIASHSWSHRDLSTLSEFDRREEMYKNEMALRNILRKIPTYMRAPYFSCNADCLATMYALGYHVIKSTVDTFDYVNNTPEKIGMSKDIMLQAIQGTDRQSQSIVALMHDIQAETVKSLTGYTLSVMKQAGWQAVTVGECLGDPKENWYRPM